MATQVSTSGIDVSASGSGGMVAACLGHSTVHILDTVRKQQKTDKAGGTDYGGSFLPVEQGPHIASLKQCAGLSSKAQVCLLLGNELLAASDGEIAKFNAKTGSIIWNVRLEEPPVKVIDVSALRPGCFLLVCHRSVLCLKWHDGQTEWASEPYTWSDSKPIDDDSLFEKHCCIHDAALDIGSSRLWCAFGQHALPLAVGTGSWESPGATRCIPGTRDLLEDKLHPDVMHFMVRDIADDVSDFASQRVAFLDAQEPLEEPELDIDKLLREVDQVGETAGASASRSLPPPPLGPRSKVALKETYIEKIVFLPADDAVPGSKSLLILTGSTRGLYAVSAETGAPVWLHMPYWKCGMAGILKDDEAPYSSTIIPNSLRSVAHMQLHTVYPAPTPTPPQRLLVTVRGNWNMYCLDADSGEERWRTSVSAALGGELFDDQETFEYPSIEWVSRQPPPPPVALHVCVERDFVAVASSEGRLGLWRLGSGEHIVSFSTGLFSGPQLGQGSIAVQYPPGHKLDLWPSAHPDPLSESAMSWDTAAGKQSHEALFTWAIKHSFGDAMTKVTLLLEAGGCEGAADTVAALQSVPHLSAAPAPWSTTVHQERRVVPGALAGAGVRLAVDGFFRSKSASSELVLAKLPEVDGHKCLLTATTDGVMSLWNLAKGKSASATGSAAGKSALLWRRTFKHYAPFVSQYTKPEHMKLLQMEHDEGWDNVKHLEAQEVAESAAAAPDAPPPPLPGSAGSVPPERSEAEQRPKVEGNAHGQRLSQAILVNGNKRLLTVAAGERHHTLRLWSVAEGELIKVFSVPHCALQISPLCSNAIPGMFGGMADDLVSFASLDVRAHAVMLHVVRASDLATLLWMPLHPTQLRPLEVPLQFNAHLGAGNSMVFTVGCKLRQRLHELREDTSLAKQVHKGLQVFSRWGGVIASISKEQLEQSAITSASVVFSVELPIDDWIRLIRSRHLPPDDPTLMEQCTPEDWAHTVPVPLPMIQITNMLRDPGYGEGTGEHIKNRLLVMRDPVQLSGEHLSASSRSGWSAVAVAIGSLTLSLLHPTTGEHIGQLDANDMSHDVFPYDAPRPILCFTCAAVRWSEEQCDLLYVMAPAMRDGVSSSTVLARYRVAPQEEGSDSLKVTLECSRELQGRPTKMFFSTDNEILAAIMPGEGIWLLDGRDMSLLKDHMYPFDGAVQCITFLHSGEEDTLLNKDVKPEHRKRMLVMGSDGQLQDVPLTDFFGLMAMARVVDLGDAEEAAATGQVDMTGALFYIGLVSAILLLVLDFFQMASFALSAATPPSLDSTAESVAQFQALGIVGVDVNFKLVYWLCVGVLVFFFALFAGSEAIEGYAFRRQEDVVAQTVWIVVTSIAQVMTTVAVIPLVRVLAGAFDCIPLSDEVEGLPWNAVGGQECFRGDHLAFFFISIVLPGLYLPVVVRLLLVGNDLTRVELLLSKPWDWSQDDRNDPPREHLLSLTGSRFGPAQALVKLLASIIYVLGGTRFTIGSSCLVLLLGVALMVISYREPPYFNETMNHIRSALDTGVVWTYLTAVVASIVLDGGGVQSGSGSDITLTVLPCLILLVLPLAYAVRRYAVLERCCAKQGAESKPASVEPLQSVQVHASGAAAPPGAADTATAAAAESEDTKPPTKTDKALSDTNSNAVSQNPVASLDDTSEAAQESAAAASVEDGEEAPAAAAGAAASSDDAVAVEVAPPPRAVPPAEKPDRSELPLPFHFAQTFFLNKADLPLVAGLCHTDRPHYYGTECTELLRSQKVQVKEVQRAPVQWM